MPGVAFVGVQRELRQADAERLSADRASCIPATCCRISATPAAVLTLADLLVSVDTSVVHVAGALGRPAIVLLPFQPDWRWTLDRDRGPWYPHVRIVRQQRPGDWSGAIAGLRDRWPEFLAGSPG